MIARLLVAGLLLVAVLAAAPPARADGDADDFRANCANCHTIGGGRLVGPDLKDVTKRQRREWLRTFIVAPQAVISSGDPYAQKLVSEARGVVMAPIPGMTEKRADGLLDLIEQESVAAKPRFAKVGLSDRPFTAADEQAGREIVLGTRSLVNGGSACLSCHAVGDTGGLGGGRLGPDLSDAFGRLGGRQALGAWLMAPPTPTMRIVFGGKALDPETEILPILAYLKGVADRHEAPVGAPGRVTFLLLGVAGAGLFLVLMDLAWKRRFRSVRTALVQSQRGSAS